MYDSAGKPAYDLSWTYVFTCISCFNFLCYFYFKLFCVILTWLYFPKQKQKKYSYSITFLQ